MADPVWHYMSGGRPAGPVSFDELKALYAAGTVGPDNPVMQEGSGGWVSASAVRELSASPSLAESPGKVPLVACEKCAARISDAAERCPLCGHPQAPLIAQGQGEELSPCPQCGVLNRVRTRTAFLLGECRGCGRSTAELYPQQQFEAQVDHLFADCSRVRNDYRTGIVVAGIFGGIAAVWAIERIVGPDPAGLSYFFGILAAGGGALPAFPWFYFQLFIRGRRRLQPPNADRIVDLSEWSAAAVRAARSGARPPWRDWVWVIYVGTVVAFFLTVFMIGRLSAIKRDREIRTGTAFASGVTASKGEGLFSSDVYLTNESPFAYGPCDLYIAIGYASGKQHSVSRQWAAWAPGERKTVNVPASGRIERIELAGTVVDPIVGLGRVNASYDWRTKKP